jgi:hypothetical protein
MSRVAAIVLLAFSLTACSVIDTLIDGFKHVAAVENDLQASTGVKPKVGFQWTNGRLVTVTVTFPRLYTAKPLVELAAMVRASVTRQFKQTPNDIVLGFSLGNAPPGQSVQLDGPPANTQRAAL